MAYPNLTCINGTNINCTTGNCTPCSTLAPQDLLEPLTIAQNIRIVIYLLSFLLSLNGNGSIIIIMLRDVYFRKTITAFRFLIAHLALTDFLFSLNTFHLVPSEINHGEEFDTLGLCFFWRMFRQIPFMASVGTITVIAIERYRGITSAVTKKWSHKRVLVALIPIWFISFVIYIPHMLVFRLNSRNCEEKWSKTIYKQLYSIFLLLFEYIFPLTIIGICYMKIAMTLATSGRRISHFEMNPQVIQRQKEQKRTVRILMAIVLGFAILTLPNAVLFLYVDFSTTIHPSTQDIIHAFAVILLLHTFFNPVVYSILDKSFRQDVKFIYTCVWCGCSEKARVKRMEWREGPRKSSSATSSSRADGNDTHSKDTSKKPSKSESRTVADYNGSEMNQIQQQNNKIQDCIPFDNFWKWKEIE